MKKARKRKSATARAKKSITPKSASAAQGRISGGLVTKQPELKEQAAVARKMFLYTDDAWALHYFDQNDLHFLEREVLG
jgi:hypothetical protein